MTVRDAGIWRRRITRSEEEVHGIFELVSAGHAEA